MPYRHCRQTNGVFDWQTGNQESTRLKPDFIHTQYTTQNIVLLLYQQYWNKQRKKVCRKRLIKIEISKSETKLNYQQQQQD